MYIYKDYEQSKLFDARFENLAGKLMKLLITLVLISIYTSCDNSESKKSTIDQTVVYSPKLLKVLPEGCNQPNGAALDKKGNILMTMPNFNSNYLIKMGELSVPDPMKIIKMDVENNISDWYVFKESDKNVA